MAYLLVSISTVFSGTTATDCTFFGIHPVRDVGKGDRYVAEVDTSSKLVLPWTQKRYRSQAYVSVIFSSPSLFNSLSFASLVVLNNTFGSAHQPKFLSLPWSY